MMVSALEFWVLATARDPVAPVLDQSPLGTDGKGLAVTLGLLNCWSIPVAMLCRTFLQCLLSRMSATPVTHTAIICWLLVLWWMDWLQNRWGFLGLLPVPPVWLYQPCFWPQSAAAFRVPWGFCKEKVTLLPCSSDFIQNVSDLNVFCHEHGRNWTGGSFFTHCFKPLSSWQAAPQSPVFALAQGHAANVSLAFTLAVWLGHMTPHRHPAPQYVTVPTQSNFCRALVLGAGSQFLKSWVCFFFLSCSKKQHRFLQSWIKKSSYYAHCVWGDFTHLHSHSTHSQHVNQGHNLSDMYKQRNYMTCQTLT